MKIYTRTGDSGETGLFGGPRVAKDAARVEAYGTVDELNAALGVARAASLPGDLDRLTEAIQHDLFEMGAQLATPPDKRKPSGGIEQPLVDALEAAIDRLESDLPSLQQFILPGGSAAAAQLHLARAVCRRAERRLVTLIRQEDQADEQLPLVYLNRLSDLLFVMSRAANAAAGHRDVPWKARK